MRAFYLVSAILFCSAAWGDTPAPGTVKAKTYTGDGVTAITSTGAAGALDVNITNSGGLSTVSQGTAGTDPWFVSVRNNAPLPVNACQETGGNLATIASELGAPLAVTGTFWQATQPVTLASPLPAGSNNIGTVNVNGTIPISGSLTANQGTPGPSASPWPVITETGSVTSAVQSGSWTVTADAGTGTFTVDGSGHTQPVSGTFWQATQPVSGTFWQATQPVSAAALPLPSGAATSAKQPALGTAGTPSSDVLTVQGHSGMTALLVDGSGSTQPVSGDVTATQGAPGPSASPWPVILESGSTTAATQSGAWTVTANAGSGTFTVDGSGHTQPVSGTFWQATQPVSGTVTANIGTSGSLALDATVSGLQVSQGSTTSGQNGELLQGAVTTAAPTYTTGKTDPFSLTTAGALRIDGSGSTQPVSGTFWQSTQPVSLATLPALTSGSALIGKVGIDQTTPGTTNGVQVNAALPAGSNVIGKVSIDQTTPGTTNLVALAANQSVNVAQINATTPLMGNGVTGTGSQRVTIASDNTAFSVNATPKTPTAVTVKQAALSIGTSAVRLTNDGSAPPSTRVLLIAQLLSTSTANCFLGSSGVTTTSTTRGVQMFAGQTFSFSNDAGDYYAICDASSQTFFVTEQE